LGKYLPLVPKLQLWNTYRRLMVQYTLQSWSFGARLKD